MEIRQREEDRASIIEVSGEVDLYSSPRMRDALLKLIKARAKAIIINLGGVSYMDSSGIATLVEGLQRCREYGGSFRLVGLKPDVMQVFRLARLTDAFEIYGDEAEALRGH
ncbi:MAG: STAS domain-containing protein [Nitrospinota bacterium]